MSFRRQCSRRSARQEKTMAADPIAPIENALESLMNAAAPSLSRLSLAAVVACTLCAHAPPSPAQPNAVPAAEPGHGAAQTVVRIAHVAPLSGSIAHVGKDSENGVRMAAEDLNARGLTLGGRKVRFELAAEDDAGEPKQATQVAQKLCDKRVAAVVGHLTSGTAMPAARIYSECGIPNVTATATHPKLTQAGYKTTFRVIANDNMLGAAMAEHAAAAGIQTVAVVDDRTAYGQGIAEVFKRTARAKGLRIASEQFTTDKATDFSVILTAIKAKAPQAIFFGGVDAQAGPMLRQMEQLGLRGIAFYGGDGMCSAKLPELAGAAALVEQVVCAEGGVSIERMPGGKAWKQRYDARFPGEFQVASPYAYDATMVLADAMLRADSAEPKVYAAKLADARWDGVTARIEFAGNGDLKRAAIARFQYRDGRKQALP
jgi:branched-chain amino acid transport system substrate-binding protein